MEETLESFTIKVLSAVINQQNILKFSCPPSDIQHALSALANLCGVQNYMTYALNEGVEVKTAAVAIMRNLPAKKSFTHKL